MNTKAKLKPQPAADDGPHPVGPALDAVMGRFALRLDEAARSLGLSTRTVQRLKAAGRFPHHDLIINRTPLWRPETIRAWVEKGGDV